MIHISVPGGSNEEILSLAKAANKAFDREIQFHIFDVEDNIASEHLAYWQYHPCESIEDMIFKSVEFVAQGEGQVLMKGLVQTRDLLKQVLNIEHNLVDQTILSHATLVNLPKRSQPFILTDAAMNIQPDQDQLIAITENAILVAKATGITHPRVALLSSAETFNPKMPSSVLAQGVSDYFQDHDDVTVFGPISLDLAMSPEAVEHKRFEGPIQGDADVIVVPSIDVGNVLYKALVIFADATMGGTIVGTKVPIVLTSRSDATKSKLYALEFALMQIQE